MRGKRFDSFVVDEVKVCDDMTDAVVYAWQRIVDRWTLEVRMPGESEPNVDMVKKLNAAIDKLNQGLSAGEIDRDVAFDVLRAEIASILGVEEDLIEIDWVNRKLVANIPSRLDYLPFAIQLTEALSKVSEDLLRGPDTRVLTAEKFQERVKALRGR